MDVNFLFNLHSGVRWIIVLVGVIALVRFAVGMFGKQAYDSIGRVSLSILNVVVTIQFLLGLVLITWKGTLVGTASYWGYALGHAIIMVIAIGTIGATGGRVKRATTDEQKWRTGTIGLVAASALIFVGVLAVNGW